MDTLVQSKPWHGRPIAATLPRQATMSRSGAASPGIRSLPTHNIRRECKPWYGLQMVGTSPPVVWKEPCRCGTPSSPSRKPSATSFPTLHHRPALSHRMTLPHLVLLACPDPMQDSLRSDPRGYVQEYRYRADGRHHCTLSSANAVHFSLREFLANA